MRGRKALHIKEEGFNDVEDCVFRVKEFEGEAEFYKRLNARDSEFYNSSYVYNVRAVAGSWRGVKFRRNRPA